MDYASAVKLSEGIERGLVRAAEISAPCKHSWEEPKGLIRPGKTVEILAQTCKHCGLVKKVL